MAWDQLDTEIGELFSFQVPDRYEIGVSMLIRDRSRDPEIRDLSALRFQRKLQEYKRKQYGPADRNRTYSTRPARRLYERGAACAHDKSGRFIPKSSGGAQ